MARIASARSTPVSRRARRSVSDGAAPCANSHVPVARIRTAGAEDAAHEPVLAHEMIDVQARLIVRRRISTEGVLMKVASSIDGNANGRHRTAKYPGRVTRCSPHHECAA